MEEESARISFSDETLLLTNSSNLSGSNLGVRIPTSYHLGSWVGVIYTLDSKLPHISKRNLWKFEKDPIAWESWIGKELEGYLVPKAVVGQ